jgi:hypothetical protein
VRSTASCAGVGSTSSVSSPRGFGVEFHPRYVGKLLQKLGFSPIRARPRHPAQDERIVEAFKKRMGRPVCKGFFESADDQSAATYPASEDSLPAKMEIRALRSS